MQYYQISYDMNSYYADTEEQLCGVLVGELLVGVFMSYEFRCSAYLLVSYLLHS